MTTYEERERKKLKCPDNVRDFATRLLQSLDLLKYALRSSSQNVVKDMSIISEK